MNLKDMATPVECDGMTLYIMGWRTPAVTSASAALVEIRPYYNYVHKKRGIVQFDPPKGYEAARKRAEAIKAPLESDWERRIAWGVPEVTFSSLLPRIVAVDFPPEQETSREVQYFKTFWHECRNAPVQQSWEIFQASMPEPLLNRIWEALSKVDDNPAPADPQLAQSAPPEDADPQSGSGGGAPTETTKDT